MVVRQPAAADSKPISLWAIEVPASHYVGRRDPALHPFLWLLASGCPAAIVRAFVQLSACAEVEMQPWVCRPRQTRSHPSPRPRSWPVAPSDGDSLERVWQTGSAPRAKMNVNEVIAPGRLRRWAAFWASKTRCTLKRPPSTSASRATTPSPIRTFIMAWPFEIGPRPDPRDRRPDRGAAAKEGRFAEVTRWAGTHSQGRGPSALAGISATGPSWSKAVEAVQLSLPRLRSCDGGTCGGHGASIGPARFGGGGWAER